MFYKVIRGEVIKVTKDAVNVKTVWEGTNLGELAKKFPRKYFTNGNTMDELRRVDMQKSLLVTAFLKRESESDEWKTIEDPRPFIGAIPHGESRVIPIDLLRIDLIR